MESPGVESPENGATRFNSAARAIEKLLRATAALRLSDITTEAASRAPGNLKIAQDQKVSPGG